jgi:hypothetical protein
VLAAAVHSPLLTQCCRYSAKVHSPVLTQCGCYSAAGSSASLAVGSHPTCEYHCLRNPLYQTDPVDTQRTAVNGRYRQNCMSAGRQVLLTLLLHSCLLGCDSLEQVEGYQHLKETCCLFFPSIESDQMIETAASSPTCLLQ